MNGKKAKVLRRLAKAIGEHQGLTDLSYVEKKSGVKDVLDLKTMKTTPVQKTQKLLGNCERLRHQRLKRTYKKMKEQNLSGDQARDFLVRRNSAPVLNNSGE